MTGARMMTFEDWIRDEIEARATVTVSLGQARDGSHALLMTRSDKIDGTHFWRIEADRITHIAFVADE